MLQNFNKKLFTKTIHCKCYKHHEKNTNMVVLKLPSNFFPYGNTNVLVMILKTNARVHNAAAPRMEPGQITTIVISQRRDDRSI